MVSKENLVIQGLGRVKQAVVEPLIYIQALHKEAWREYGPLKTALAESIFLVPPVMAVVMGYNHHPFLSAIAMTTTFWEVIAVPAVYYQEKRDYPRETKELLTNHRLGYQQPSQLELFK